MHTTSIPTTHVLSTFSCATLRFSVRMDDSGSDARLVLSADSVLELMILVR